MSLSIDCIREILDYLSEDKKSLYSCLLTNRLFCRITVPILWRDPWINISFGDFSLKEQIYWDSIGKTLIKCFLKEIKQFPIFLKNRKQSHLLQQQSPPLFNYILYIQIISSGVINNLVKSMFEDFNNSLQIEQIYNKELWSIFMKRCSKIKSIEMPSFNLLEYPGSKDFLSSISTLKIIASYPKEIVLELSKTIHTLNRIEFCLDHTFEDLNEDNNIITLILSQKNLREIKFIHVTRQIFLFNKKTIEHLSKSLTTLELCSWTYLPVQTISPFNNLRELKICFRILYHDDSIINLNQIYLPKLEILSLINIREKDLTTFIGLIGTTKGSLKILNICLRTRSTTSLSTSSITFYLHTIKTICPDIEVLPMWLIPGVSLKEFEDLLRSCSKVRKVILHAIIPFDITIAKQILYLLATISSSPHLNNIHLIGEWNFSNLDKEFFDLWKEKKRRPLELILNSNIHSNYIVKFLVTNGNKPVYKYKCNMCFRIFYRLEHANRHIRTHFIHCSHKCWNDCEASIYF